MILHFLLISGCKCKDFVDGAIPTLRKGEECILTCRTEFMYHTENEPLKISFKPRARESYCTEALIDWWKRHCPVDFASSNILCKFTA